MDESRVQVNAPMAGSPPGPAAPSGTTTSAQGPERKRRGCLIALVVTLVLLALLVVGAYLTLGRALKPQDLGVAYSEADFQSAVSKAGVAWPEPPAGGNIEDYERVYTGEQPLDATFTEAELSALMSYNHNSSYWPIKSMQIALTGGNTAQASALVTYAGRDWPVSVSGSGGITGNTLAVTFAAARVAGIDVPAQYFPIGESFLEDMVNSRLGRIPGLGIDSLEVTEEGVHVTGTIWQTAEYVQLP